MAEISSKIELQLQGRDEIVEIDCENVEDASEICGFLANEPVAYKQYLPFALYFNIKKNKPDDAITLLEQGLRSGSGTPQSRLPLVNLLASLYIKKAKELHSSMRDEKQRYLELATSKYNEASHINSREPVTWVGKGLLYLARNDADLAYRAFANALDVAPNNIPALFGKARVQYHRRNFESALETYQTILRLNPKCKPDPRIGIGLCFNKLNLADHAYRAFLRALEVDPNNVAANILVAQIELNRMKDANFTKEEKDSLLAQATRRIVHAHHLDPKHPTALNLLANCLFYTQRVDQVDQDAEEYTTLLDVTRRAEIYSDTKPILSESHYQQGRVHHLMQNWDEALYHYSEATRTYEEHHPAQFGLSQVYIRKGQIKLAKPKLYSLLNKYPGNVDILTVLAMVQAHLFNTADNPHEKEEARKEFDKLTKMIKDDKFDDPQIFTIKGQLLEEENWHKGLSAYKRAVELYIDKGEIVPPQLLNNIGVNYFRQPDIENHYESALDYFRRALENANLTKELGAALTIKYNIARTNEYLGRTEEALQEYYSLATDHPAHVDAHLRIAAIYEDNREWEKAEDIYNAILKFDESNVTVRAAFGRHFYKQGNLREMRSQFERVLSKFDRHHIFSLLSLGSYWLGTAREIKDNKDEKKRRYKKAHEFFTKALQLEERSIWAANGIAVFAAESGWLQQAKEAFYHIRQEAYKGVPDITINLAHVLVELGEYDAAIKEYESVRKLTRGEDVQLLLWLARAYYIAGKVTKSIKHMQDALACCQRAYLAKPNGDSLITYNIGICQQSLAQLISEQETGERSSVMLEYQSNDVECSRRLFERCIKLSEEVKNKPGNREKIYYNVETAHQRVKFADSPTKKKKKD
ncbi:6891_t:CDS:10 [Ambispora leptoticha]|uniref:6891_t:CDS:1 n=1 Tax=Ambispora leptoticha TaxID=144679 RepID=A0A9N9AIN4_9GLOM|nr:6891_t:CDS:10 [Ambispora leptoticha]